MQSLLAPAALAAAQLFLSSNLNLMEAAPNLRQLQQLMFSHNN